MNRRKRKFDRRAVDLDQQLPEEAADATDPEGDAESDRLLAKRCLMGEVAAWEELYGRFHDPLCRAVRGMLGGGGLDLSRVDEIAARVWYALVRNDGELLNRFDPARHTRLGGFLRGLARIEIMQYYRAEYRRRAQETACCVGRACGDEISSDWQVTSMIDDFATTLTPGEHEFLEEHLLGGPEAGRQRWSDAAIWQRCHRIREKLKAFFLGGS
jgi:hypothetical protein